MYSTPDSKGYRNGKKCDLQSDKYDNYVRTWVNIVENTTLNQLNIRRVLGFAKLVMDYEELK